MTAERLDRITVLTWALVALGIVLRTWQYAIDRALWVDEARLALNVIDRSWTGLLQPLDYAQAAPIGFLYATKAAISIAGPGEHVLRLLPFAAAVAALILFCVLARRVVSRAALPLAVALFACSPVLLYFAGESKQYSLDALAAITIALCSLRIADLGLTRRAAAGAAAVGVLGLLFSQAAIFVLAGTGVVLAWRFRGGWRVLAPVLAVWAAAGCLFVVLPSLSIDPTSAHYLAWFWQRGYLPAPTSLQSMAVSVLTFVEAFRDPVGLTIPAAGAVLFAYGAAKLENPARWLLLAPLAFAVAAAAFHLYPFGGPGLPTYPGRMILFLTPALMLGTAEGVANLMRAQQRPVRLAGLAIAVLLATQVIVSGIAATPQRRDDVRPALAFIRSGLTGSDRIYAHHNALPQLRYYAAAYRMHDVNVEGGDRMGAPAEWYAEQVERLEPGSVWFVFAHLSGDVPALDTALHRNGIETARFDASGVSVRHIHLTREPRAPQYVKGPRGGN